LPTSRTITEELADRCARAIADLFSVDDVDVARTIARSREDIPADYQCNIAFALAKRVKRAPRDVAAEIAERVSGDGPIGHAEAAGPGFINLVLADAWLIDQVQSPEPPLPRPARREKVLVDFSSPNVAKEMHVGHLRSTIIGDALSRLFEALGHEVERVSHVGDWGTQFGMLIAHLRELGDDLETIEISDLNEFYKEAKERFDTDEAFRTAARETVVGLQGGAEEARRAWRILVARSEAEFRQIYDVLGVHLVERGESYYQPYLEAVVEDLTAQGLLVEDNGAQCVFLEQYRNKAGEPLPLIVRKADGGYNYATTDLAAVRHRVEEGFDRILYVVDAGQSQHFQMVFETARKAGWVPEHVVVEHIPFGLVLGEDGKRLRTRSGETPKLRDLLDAAIGRATLFVQDRRKSARGNRSDADAEELGRILGVGSLRYAELSHNRMTNYVFALDKMVSLQGNTAPYLLYVYARIASIVEEAGALRTSSRNGTLGQEERALAVALAGGGDVLIGAINEYAPNLVSEYLYGLCQAFNRFYETSRVIDGDVADPLRLALCAATAATLRQGFDLLGVEVVSEL
jgi:arginyl-tRNA synthetase